MVLLTTTPQVLDLISSLPTSALASLKAASSEPLPSDISSPISHKTLITLSRLLRNSHNDGMQTSTPLRSGATAASHKLNNAQAHSLNTLLRSTRVYVPPPKAKPQPTPEYVALMTRLRADAERRQYQTLVSQQTENLLGTERRHDGDGDTAHQEEDKDPITPSLVINIFLSVVLSAVAVFVVSRWWGNQAMRVLLSIAAGIVVGVAEVVVYAGYVRNVRRSKVKERSKKERKVLLGAYTGDIDGDVYDGTGAKIVVDRGRSGDGFVSVDQDVIWGKGKHGGMRRRVRERWEKDQEKDKDKSMLDRRKDT